MRTALGDGGDEQIKTGYPSKWIERQLARQERNAVKAAENYAEHLPERWTMMQRWAGHLDQLKAGDVAKVD